MSFRQFLLLMNSVFNVTVARFTKLMATRWKLNGAASASPNKISEPVPTLLGARISRTKEGKRPDARGELAIRAGGLKTDTDDNQCWSDVLLPLGEAAQPLRMTKHTPIIPSGNRITWHTKNVLGNITQLPDYELGADYPGDKQAGNTQCAQAPVQKIQVDLK
ncbi:hypothetical protein C8R44DRAFT_744173 [Mycena epipterygia]|nr:hypothetical protein C8R44DRAFT_744173 [Mycena epipterygia]